MKTLCPTKCVGPKIFPKLQKITSFYCLQRILLYYKQWGFMAFFVFCRNRQILEVPKWDLSGRLLRKFATFYRPQRILLDYKQGGFMACFVFRRNRQILEVLNWDHSGHQLRNFTLCMTSEVWSTRERGEIIAIFVILFFGVFLRSQNGTIQPANFGFLAALRSTTWASWRRRRVSL